MRFYVGVTDTHWFRFLSASSREDVNFWQPSGSSQSARLNHLEPFLFKLKAPIHAIGGVGFFVRHSVLPLSLAWKIFGERNGTATFEELHHTIAKYRRGRGKEPVPDPHIGCIVLTDPVFFREEDWIAAPADWGRSIMQGKYYDALEGEGQRLWGEVQERLLRYRDPVEASDKPAFSVPAIHEDSPRWGEAVTKVRLGQGSFRVSVMESYQRRCAISGEKVLPVLEAAHIKPYARSGPHAVDNGLLLRSDIHTLFDAGYMTVTKDGGRYAVEVSSRLQTEFENGKDYYQFQGKSPLILPRMPDDCPSETYLAWHNENVFR